ncbi:carbohydrate ABC transporter permease [Haloimpatiens massiliensis]|uniref:carbohydrate ABC transporter permease n=1 Tax=Haloimpatiens massiliensis TaxID=1658110 RepID=UPI001FA84AEA|nr:sugar ABC transporter permease [Haloimpatiens massiliensis]
MNKNKKISLSKLKPYGYIMPLGIILFSFYIIPIIMSIYFSFTKYNIMTPAVFTGMDNYKRLFQDKVFIDAVKNTIMVTLVVVPIQTILSLLMAVWLVGKKESKLAKFVRGVVFIPVISSMILIGIVWRVMLNSDMSPINYIMSRLFNVSANWLGNPKTALPTLMVISIWKNIGYFIVIYIAALMDIPSNYYEASKVDGANKLQEFFHITLPLLKPTTIMVVFLGTIWSFQIFDLVYTLTGGGPGTTTMTLVMHIYNLSFKEFNAGYAMTVANILFLIIAMMSILQRKFLRREESSI